MNSYILSPSRETENYKESWRERKKVREKARQRLSWRHADTDRAPRDMRSLRILRNL